MRSTPLPRLLLLPLLIAVLALGGSAVLPRMAGAVGSMSVTGYAWSQYMGWISFSGTGYGVSEDTTTGALSGYAWSSNFGWISFNASDGTHPAGAANVITKAVTGWARACAAFADKNACSGALDANSGGWDGWIALAGTASDSSTYGVTQNANCTWTGYAWGSDSIGAISMSGTAADSSAYGVTASDASACAGVPTATLSASPDTIDNGQSSTLTWSSTSATSCTAAGGFSTGGATSGSVSVGPLSSTQNYQISCTGTGGSVNSNVATVTVLTPTVTISAVPNRVVRGGTTTVSWNATNVNSCGITRNGTTWQTLTADGSRTVAGSAPDTITSQTTYIITCTNNAGASVTATATQVVNIQGSFGEF